MSQTTTTSQPKKASATPVKKIAATPVKKTAATPVKKVAPTIPQAAKSKAPAAKEQPEKKVEKPVKVELPKEVEEEEEEEETLEETPVASESNTPVASPVASPAVAPPPAVKAKPAVVKKVAPPPAPGSKKKVAATSVKKAAPTTGDKKKAPATATKVKPAVAKKAKPAEGAGGAVKSEKGTKKPRRVITAETLEQTFKELQAVLLEEIEKRKEKTDKITGVKALRTISKRVKGAHLDTMRVIKKLTKKKRKKGEPSERKVVSGFSKPCKITPALAGFMGCEADEMKSRVDATRAVIKYIKDLKLQDEKKPRIIHPDVPLATLLGYKGTEKNDKGELIPLTFFYIQKLIQPHFIKEPKVIAVAPEEPAEIEAAA